MSLAIPTSDKLTKEEWKILVCAMFTGVQLYNGGRLMLYDSSPEEYILKILQENTNWTIEQTGDSEYIYLPFVTVVYQEDYQGVIMGEVFSCSTSEHAEKKFLSKTHDHLRSVHGIGLNYSPCTGRCADVIVNKYRRGEEEEALPKPVIHFSWVHNHPKKEPHGQDGIKLLIENGFNLKVWETTKIVHFLLEQAPNESLKHGLKLVYDKMSLEFSKRDMETQELIEEAKKMVDKDRGRKNRKRNALEEPGQKRPAAQKVSYTRTRKISMFMVFIFLIQE